MRRSPTFPRPCSNPASSTSTRFAARSSQTAKLPRNWRQRALRIANPETEGAIGIAPEVHDIYASKLIAMREKDFEFTQAAIDAGLATPSVLLERLAEIDEVPQVLRERAAAWVTARESDQHRP
jgi:hypothetical protein